MFGPITKPHFLPNPAMIFDEHRNPIGLLSEHVEQLKNTIESSKFFMSAIIEKVRSQGKIKIINQLNHNPQHPEFDSSFPDLFTVTPKANKDNDFYPFKKLDENFDLKGRKNILKMDEQFTSRTNKNIAILYAKNFINHNNWEVSDQLNSSKNIENTIKMFQEHYKQLLFSDELDKKFMKDFNPSIFIVNNNVIPSRKREEMIQDFKNIIPNIQLQKLISTYANQYFLHQSYLQFSSEHPEINQYQAKNVRNIYEVNCLDDGAVKLIATNLSDINPQNNNIEKYQSFGVRATIIFPQNSIPIIKYSHFLK